MEKISCIKTKNILYQTINMAISAVILGSMGINSLLLLLLELKLKI